jgi:hypothetical protein
MMDETRTDKKYRTLQPKTLKILVLELLPLYWYREDKEQQTTAGKGIVVLIDENRDDRQLGVVWEI